MNDIIFRTLKIVLILLLIFNPYTVKVKVEKVEKVTIKLTTPLIKHKPLYLKRQRRNYDTLNVLTKELHNSFLLLNLDSSEYYLIKSINQISQGESGFGKSNRGKYDNNLYGIRYGKRATSYKQFYGVYDKWQDSSLDLIDYLRKYKSRSWYNRYNYLSFKIK